MAYCTKIDILEALSEEELIGLTDDFDAGVVDDSRVTRAISDADAEIDGYCGEKYNVPFSPAPAIIRKLSVDIAVYNLYARRQGAPENRKERYDSAIRVLKDVSKGAVSLGADAPTETSEDKVSTSSEDRIFDRDKLEGF